MRGLLQHWTKSSIIPSSKKNQSGRTRGPEARPFPSWQTDCLLDLRILPGVTGSQRFFENYADLFTISLRNDDIQEFDSKWDGILLSITWRFIVTRAFVRWQYCLYSHVWWTYEIKRANRLSQALVHFVIDRANLFTDHRMSSLPIRVKHMHFRTN